VRDDTGTEEAWTSTFWMMRDSIGTERVNKFETGCVRV